MREGEVRTDMNSSQKLRRCAETLMKVLDRRDLSQPLLAEAKTRLDPLVRESLGKQKDLPDRLPRFFFGMHDHELGASYLHDTELINALSEFEDAMAVVAQRKQ